MMHKKMNFFNIFSMVVGISFLYIPIILLIIFSFNHSRLVSVWGGFSIKWYRELFENKALIESVWASLRIAASSASVATILGVLAALLLHKSKAFRLRLFFSSMLLGVFFMPEMIAGLSFLLLFIALGFDRGFLTIFLSHVTVSMCFVAIIIQSRLVSLDSSLQEAAMDLGASQIRTFFYIIVPLILPSIVSAWLLAFTLSLDDFVITSFTSGPGITTLPVKIYSQVRFGITPEINAVCTIFIAVVALTTILVACINKSFTETMK